tara:strand:- start:73 stop:279 length:207 start_codon:yes stop_codon:yes gene_type:complete
MDRRIFKKIIFFDVIEKLLGLRKEVTTFSWVYGIHECIKKGVPLFKRNAFICLVTIMIWFVWPVYRQI